MARSRGPKKLFEIPHRWDRTLSLTVWSSFSALLVLILFETIHVYVGKGFSEAYQGLLQTGFLFLGVLGWAFLLGSLPVSWLLADVKSPDLPRRRLIGRTALAGWSAAALSFALYNTLMGLIGVHETILLDAHYSLILVTAGVGSGVGYFLRSLRFSSRRKRKRVAPAPVPPVASRSA